jgi:2-keto-4-pentenoate hydratase/2-oxohepta-3-ene-1,7-dioic acid hydratase in catechol pathway
MKSIPGLPQLTIGSVYCIGRNYQKHAHELGNSVPDKPLVFLKPASSLIGGGGTIILPSQSHVIHHEVELVIAIGDKCHNISQKNARKYIAGLGVGIDVTARDIQLQAKKAGHPWSIAKGFDTFAPVSSFAQLHDEIDLSSLRLSLNVNSELRQKGNTSEMIFGIDEIIAYLSTPFTLYPGDLIFTGTPEGVSEIQESDSIQAELTGEQIHLSLSVDVARGDDS